MDKNCKVEKNILLYAMRYALGRPSSFAPITVIGNVKININLFTVDELEMLIQNIENYTYRHGMEFNKPEWMDFKDYLQNYIDSTTIVDIIPRH